MGGGAAPLSYNVLDQVTQGYCVLWLGQAELMRVSLASYMYTAPPLFLHMHEPPSFVHLILLYVCKKRGEAIL